MQLKVKDHIWDGFPKCKCSSCIVNQAWNATFPEMRMVMADATNRASERGYVIYWSGRRKHYGTRFNRGEEHKAFNALCQGGGAEIVKHALVKCRDIENESAKPVLTVHDSLVWEVKPEKVESLVSEVSEVMTDFDFPVDLAVDAHKWGEG